MAEDTDQDQKTEEPSQKRLDQAREQGQLPISRDLAIFVNLLACLVVLVYLGPMVARQMVHALRLFLEIPDQIGLNDFDIRALALSLMLSIGGSILAIFALMMAVGFLGTMIQTDFFISMEMLKFDVMRLSPVAGFQRVFSKRALFELFKSFFKVVLMGAVVVMFLLPILKQTPGLSDHNLLFSLDLVLTESRHILLVLLFIVGLIGITDLVYQRREYHKQMMMTKTEVKDEYKQMEGDPLIRRRLRQLRMERARKRMMAKVPDADVVVTNPTHYAVALQYDRAKMRAPVVVAKGADNVAQRIREVAEENNVPLVSNPTLARALYDTVELDQPIKTEYYKAVAEIISYVFKLKKKSF